MTVEKLELKSNPGATLTAYLLDTSKEMPNMTDRPAVLVMPGGGYYMCLSLIHISEPTRPY